MGEGETLTTMDCFRNAIFDVMGASVNSLPLTMKLLMPASLDVGMSGSTGKRSGLNTASARTLPPNPNASVAVRREALT